MHGIHSHPRCNQRAGCVPLGLDIGRIQSCVGCLVEQLVIVRWQRYRFVFDTHTSSLRLVIGNEHRSKFVLVLLEKLARNEPMVGTGKLVDRLADRLELEEELYEGIGLALHCSNIYHWHNNMAGIVQGNGVRLDSYHHQQRMQRQQRHQLPTILFQVKRIGNSI